MYAKIKKACFYGRWLLFFVIKMTVCLILALPLRLNKEYKNLWLIMELPNEARDNGYWLYKYITEKHPDVNVRYVLSKKSPDYEKMPDKDSIIRPYSWQHYISYILCCRSISTHIYGASPGRYYTKLFNHVMPRKEEVFLQHGITKEPIPLRGFSSWTITASPEEMEHFENSGHKNPERILQVGFCRFDNLSDTSGYQEKKTVLIMPTFRSWLGGHTTVDNRVFLQSDYFKKWKSLLDNKELNDCINSNNYKVIFYPHRQMQTFKELFEVDNINFEIAAQSDYDIQDLLRKSSILITDYSSVFYDFSYMKKPVIFYAFDKERFYADHHEYSGRPYPFGEYSYSENDLLRRIKKYAANEFKISDKALREVNDFFVHTDKNNCERNFEAIKALSR